MSSTFYRESDGMIFCGFAQGYKGKKIIATGINEGYTQLLAERYFGESKDILKAYSCEKSIAEKLEMIVGKEKMQSLYLNANLYGLIQELKQYEDENTIMQFISDVDFLNMHLKRKKWLLSEKNMVITKLKNANTFLLSCYLKRLQMDILRLDKETFESRLSTFLIKVTQTFTVDREKYVIMGANDIKDIINKTLKCSQEEESNVEGPIQQSGLRGK